MKNKTKWDELSIRERADLMKLFVDNDITDLNQIHSLYNSYQANNNNEKSYGGPLDYPFSNTPIPQVRYDKGGPVNTNYSIPLIPEWVGSDNTELAYSIQDTARRIKETENSKNNLRGGYNRINNKWYPHKSIEGGANTIAYGIKLSNGTDWAKTALEQGYLTDAQAEKAVTDLATTYMDSARTIYDKKYGEGEFDKLSGKSKSILADFNYNPGLGKFPNLMNGFYTEDIDKIEQNYKRYSISKNKRGKVSKKELGRNKYIKNDIDSLKLGLYPIKGKDEKYNENN